MKALIPIAGKGTRMRPHTLAHAKVLLPVAGKPMIDYIIEKLIDNNIEEIIFIIGYLGEQIIEYVQANYPQLNVSYIEQKQMLGLGHAVYMANHLIKNDELLIILGDTLFDVDFNIMTSTEYSNLGVKTVDDPSRFGVAVLENNQIIKLVEKPKTPISNLALVGLYYIKNSTLLMNSIEELINKNSKTKGEYQLTDALQIMIEKGEKFIPFQVDNWYDCGKPETMIQTNETLLLKGRDNSKNFTSHENSKILSPSFIAEGVKIENCIIGPNVSICENTIIKNCIIKNSLIDKNSNVENLICDNSIIGENVIINHNIKQLNIGDFSIL